MVKKGNQSIIEYIQKIKHISDILAVVSSPIDTEDSIFHTLNGLPREYGPFKTSIHTHSSPISIEELHVLLLCEELNLQSSQQPVTNFSTTALYLLNLQILEVLAVAMALIKDDLEDGTEEVVVVETTSKDVILLNFSHQLLVPVVKVVIELVTQMAYSFQGRQPPPQLATMPASFNAPSEHNWYADTGATNHITNDLSNLSIQANYQGKDKVAIGNGQGLFRSHVGSSVVHTPVFL